jgi:hypothetical protein
MSAPGPKRTSLVAPHMSALGGKADMLSRGAPLSRSLLGVNWPKRTFLKRRRLQSKRRSGSTPAARSRKDKWADRLPSCFTCSR